MLMAHLAVDDARIAEAAGATFARTLAGARSEDFALALAEQTDLIERAITDAGHSVEQAQLAGRQFTAAATAERHRLVSRGGYTTWGHA